MVDIIANCGLEGYYIYNGVRGRHFGEVDFLRDSKVVGKVLDSNSDSTENLIEKLFLGIYLAEENSLAFLKISPRMRDGKGLRPVLWYLREDKSLSRENIGSYGGVWDFASGLPEVVGFERSLFENGMPDIEVLNQISVEFLRGSYFNPEILNGLESMAETIGQTGGLVLTVLDE